jgi:Raf kinase inhibitor-like YbhB/YbcL family protein
MRPQIRLRCRLLKEAIRSRRKFLAAGSAFALVLVALPGCHSSTVLGQGTPSLQLTSPSFANGQIPAKFTCDGDDTSPQLAWVAPPAGTQSFALTVVDHDAPVGSFVHWVLYDLPPETRGLPEGLPKQEQLADGSKQGENDFDKIGYGGPCPPGGSSHRYTFSLYALDAKLNLAPRATRTQLEAAVKGHILAHGQLIARYKR